MPWGRENCPTPDPEVPHARSNTGAWAWAIGTDRAAATMTATAAATARSMNEGMGSSDGPGHLTARLSNAARLSWPDGTNAASAGRTSCAPRLRHRNGRRSLVRSVSMRRYVRYAGVVVLAALTLSLVESAGQQVRYASWGKSVPWTESLWRPLPHWLLLAMLAPLAMALSVRFRVRPGRWRWIPLHAVAALVFAFVHTLLGTLVYRSIL